MSPIFWTLPLTHPQPTINVIGNLGGFFGPLIIGFLIQRAGTLVIGEAFLIDCLVISGLFACNCATARRCARVRR